VSTSAYERFRRATQQSAVLARLDAVARELTGGALIVLVRRGDELLEVLPTGTDADLPDFCRVLRGTFEGRKRCLTCRSLMTFGACYRGLIEYTCHGGVSIVAAPVEREVGDGIVPIVASCAFASEDPAEGWEQLRAHASELGVDLKKLRSVYRQMPRLTEDRKPLVRALVDITACVLAEMAESTAPSRHAPRASRPADDAGRPGDSLERSLEAALFLANDHEPRKAGKADGARMVDLVVDMITRDPGMPFSVDKVARAARMTPNHFSSVFRRHTGRPFSGFLAGMRLALARKLLRDLTLSIGEVASRAGFQDNSYFARRFKKDTGMTPTQWRNSL
jgi:AraC-like DNA-binding protein